MALNDYKSKRNLKATGEPKTKAAKTSSKSQNKPLSFCVQRHDASHLHYDFRLECNGVLLSWAVPKGPSLDPQDKHLAIHVEDHPLEYQYFEGVIPKGNYGAGTVERWDFGSYTTPHSTNRQEIEKEVERGLKEGHIAFILHGTKLNGEFVLQKLKKNEPTDTSWLLIKKNDEFAENGSVKKKAKKKLPDRIQPMLATLIDKAFDDDEWIFEVKWDGYRTFAFIDAGVVELKSRNALSLNAKFPMIVKELEKVKEGNALLDGEIVVIDAKGKSHFQLLQNYTKTKGETLCYYVFDILFKEGVDLRGLPLLQRKEILKRYLMKLSLPLIRFSDHIRSKGIAFFKAAVKEQLEGIIGKKISSVYESGRSHDWVKIKSSLRQEIVICGFTEPKGSRKKIGALIAGIYNINNELQYAGHVGGGFSEALLQEVYAKLRPLIVKKCPFKTIPKVNAPVTWVEPKLLAEVAFAEWTKEDIMRQPIFQGLRMDKKATTVKKEVPEPVSALDVTPSKRSKKAAKVNDTELTNLEKVYWPKEKYTKGDLIAYYETIAPHILPYLKDRPIILHRYPQGISGADFYQKNIDHAPQGIKTFPIKHHGKVDNYLLIDNVQSLLYAINLGSIDLHPFLARITALENPDFCVIDLDPHDISFDKVVEAALQVHDLLKSINVEHVCKTSGGNGLHIVIPLNAKYDYDQSKQFAEVICTIVHQKLPKTTSLERISENRPKRVYLDYLQNRYGQSIVAPYSVRPRPEAKVSTPLLWKEVNKNLDVAKFTIKTVPQRVKKMGDIFLPVLGKGINLKAAITDLQKLVLLL